MGWDQGPAVRLRSVARSFGGVEALAGVSVDIGAGRCLGLVGHNGSGKTTLLSIVAGELRASSGRVEVCGVDLGAISDPAGVRERVAFVRDAPVFYPDLTVREHAELVGLIYGVGSREIEDRVDRLLERLRLADRAGFVPTQLSSGMSQKLQLLCTWMRGFDVLLLDEPTQALDAHARRVLGELVVEAKSDGAAVVVASHEVGFVRDVSDGVVILDRGRVAAGGPVDEVLGSDVASELGLA